MTEQRRLAAIVSADVAGYSRLMGRDESGTLAALKALRQEVVDPAITGHGGRIVKTTGDGLLLEFPSVVNAVRCAVEVQMAMATNTADLSEDRRIAFRIGINLGDIIVEGDDIFGDGVNVAARLQEIALPGGICISSRVHEDVRDRLDIAFEDGGAQILKNIVRAVQVWRWFPDSPAMSESVPLAKLPLTLPAKPSIAVLPFQNMSGDPDQEYFADGIVEDIITALSRISWFFVIARNSSFIYKGRAIDVRQVGRELGVRYIVEGSVRKAGNRLRVTGQLIDTTTGNHLWADRYDGMLDDVFDLQDRITANVAGAIEPQLQLAEIQRAQAKPTNDLSAYDLYWRALALVYQATEKSTSAALSLIEQATAADPRFGIAHGLEAQCCANSKANGWGSLEAVVARGLRAAALAIETAKDDAIALARAGSAMAYLGGRLREGLAYAERACELNPNAAGAWRAAGYINLYLGEHQKCNDCLEKVARLSPVDSSLCEVYTGIGYVCFFTHRWDQAIDWADKALRERPYWGPALWLKIAALGACRDLGDRLLETVKRIGVVMPQLSVRTIMDRFPPAPALREQFEAALRMAALPE